MSKLKTWQLNDVSKGPIYNNNHIKALRSIRTKTILMPCNQDFYFRTKDNEYEKKFIPNSSLRSINSPYGHCAVNPENDKNFEKEFDKNIRELLN